MRPENTIIDFAGAFRRFPRICTASVRRAVPAAPVSTAQG
jgi:hypothetical protein